MTRFYHHLPKILNKIICVFFLRASYKAQKNIRDSLVLHIPGINIKYRTLSDLSVVHWRG